jgi:hypothetical protein
MFWIYPLPATSRKTEWAPQNPEFIKSEIVSSYELVMTFNMTSPPEDFVQTTHNCFSRLSFHSCLAIQHKLGRSDPSCTRDKATDGLPKKYRVDLGVHSGTTRRLKRLLIKKRTIVLLLREVPRVRPRVAVLTSAHSRLTNSVSSATFMTAISLASLPMSVVMNSETRHFHSRTQPIIAQTCDDLEGLTRASATSKLLNVQDETL